MSWWSSDARIINCLTSLRSSMLSLTVRFGWNAMGLLLRGVKVGLGIKPQNIASSCWREDQVFSSPRAPWCEPKITDLVYGGDLGGGGGGRVGQDVIRQLTSGECSIDGAWDDDDGLGLGEVRWLVACSKTWARLVVLTNEGDYWEFGSIIWALLLVEDCVTFFDFAFKYLGGGVCGRSCCRAIVSWWSCMACRCFLIRTSWSSWLKRLSVYVESCIGLLQTKESKISTISYNLEVMKGFLEKNKSVARLLTVVEVSWVVESEVAVVRVTGRWSPCLVCLSLME